jgi:hypothetical protein
MPSWPDGLDGSAGPVAGAFGNALRATASLSISWAGLPMVVILTADVSIVMVGLGARRVSEARR